MSRPRTRALHMPRPVFQALWKAAVAGDVPMVTRLLANTRLRHGSVNDVLRATILRGAVPVARALLKHPRVDVVAALGENLRAAIRPFRPCARGLLLELFADPRVSLHGVERVVASTFLRPKCRALVLADIMAVARWRRRRPWLRACVSHAPPGAACPVVATAPA
jgi:hypothetical protein